ncbi:MAG: hypothetical protein R6V01_10655 [Thermoplasmatota archaeon]
MKIPENVPKNPFLRKDFQADDGWKQGIEMKKKGLSNALEGSSQLFLKVQI